MEVNLLTDESFFVIVGLMKIKLYGTGSGGSKSETVCFFIDNSILVDAPEGIYKKLMNDDVRPKLVLITHFHSDHDFGVPMLINFLRKGESYTLVAPKGAAARYGQLVELMNYPKMDLPTIIEIDSDIEKSGFDFQGYKIMPLKMSHGDVFSDVTVYGYILSKGGKTAGFSEDTVYTSNLEKMCEQADIAFIDVTGAPPPNVSEAHMSIESYKTVVVEYPETRIVPIHMSDKTRAELNSMGFNAPNDKDVFEI